jgi:putative ATP-binding cassette transporter
VLAQIGLGHLCPESEAPENWGAVLSGGEQQRLGFARLLLHKPDWAFLDEATSALDEAAERELYQMVRTQCPHTTLISVGHRTTLTAFHDRVWTLTPWMSPAA